MARQTLYGDTNGTGPYRIVGTWSREAVGIGVVVKRLRIERHWSRLELSRRVQVTQRTVKYIEFGVSNPTEKTLRKLAKAFGVTLDVFFDGVRT